MCGWDYVSTVSETGPSALTDSGEAGMAEACGCTDWTESDDVGAYTADSKIGVWVLSVC